MLNGFPDECPRCHNKVVPIPLIACRIADDAGIEEAFQCTSLQCGKVFIAVYRGYRSTDTESGFHYLKSVPLEPRPPVVSEQVATVSPTFVETYGQALASEGYGLTQLTGIGLRKALEFLVKDFAINQHATEREEIEKRTLAKCVDDYITDISVKAAAKRATWLGNDETHYVRKWEEKDINDLKVLIRLTMNGIENILLTEQYVSDMPEPKGKKEAP